MTDNPLRKLPAVNEVLAELRRSNHVADYAHETIVAAVRAELADLRLRLRKGFVIEGGIDVGTIASRVTSRMSTESQPKLQPVINATGIVLHTNLGRAPIAEEAAQAAYEAARGYLNLELDLHTGKRSSRQNAVRDWLCSLSGAESATAVNNNAAATIIVLRAICQGKEVILSRGQLIEIGGSFRIPEIMAVSGAVLREVGTTNITRLSDYERAIGPNTGALLRVHTSNYRVRGFTKSVPLTDLVGLGKQYGLPVIDDVGSGALFDFGQYGLHGEPLVRDSVAAGADLVLFSGDKLLGGPQAGLIVGRQHYVRKIEKDPFMRAIRLDKMTLAALETTLRLYQNEARARHAIPVLHMLGASTDDLNRRAETLAAGLQTLPGFMKVTVREDTSYAGGGSLPDQIMPTRVIELEAAGCSNAELALRLRTGSPPVIGRLSGGKLLLDVRTIFPHQEAALLEAVRQALNTSEMNQ